MSVLISKAFSWSKAKVKSYDWFGKNITFTYKGEYAFKTIGGGVLSLTIFGFLLFYMIYLINIMLRRSEVKTSK